jgi:hypothetical protein
VIAEKNLAAPGGSPPTAAEAIAAFIGAFLASFVVLAYFTDWIDVALGPHAILLGSCVAAGAAVWPLSRGAALSPGQLATFVAVVSATLLWLLWLSWPDLLPLGSGADLTHHLQLVEYLDRHARLPRDPSLEPYLGEMIHYTPGAHLLASLGARILGTTGLHAVHPLIAATVALKAGFVFLIAARIAPHEVRIPIGLLAVALLWLPRFFLVGSFAQYSYVAQVVSEMFAVMMWWVLIVWDERPSAAWMWLFAIAGMAVFLTWPIWIGPPLIALAAVTLARADAPPAARLRSVTVGVVPIAIAAVAHALGRLAWTRIARTGAAMAVPGLEELNWGFLALSLAGLVALSARRKGRATALLIAACAVQAAALYAAAKTAGASVPYMAIKMVYFVIHPLAVAAAAALGVAWKANQRLTRSPRMALASVWLVAAIGISIAFWRAGDLPRSRPVVSQSLHLAGKWARDHIEPACVDYITGDPETAYWLHLAVLGNRRMDARTANENTFTTNDAIVRWINRSGPAHAVADLGVIPKDLLVDADELARFGSAVVIRRRGADPCSIPASR